MSRSILIKELKIPNHYPSENNRINTETRVLHKTLKIPAASISVDEFTKPD